jgi:hypothetical protein
MRIIRNGRDLCICLGIDKHLLTIYDGKEVGVGIGPYRLISEKLIGLM